VDQKFQLVAGHLALDFANTLDYRYDRRRRIELLPSYEAFLQFAVQTGIVSAAAARKLLRDTAAPVADSALQQIIEVREAHYSLFSSVVNCRAPGPSSLRTYNRALGRYSISDVLVWRDSGFIRSSGNLTETAFGPLWPILDAGNKLLTSSGRSHIRECCEESCRWLFLDTSKNHTRKWCSMQLCGGRSKARRYYQRERAAVDSSS
jgi:predicted RNA-binding Zn ribbon-like protein